MVDKDLKIAKKMVDEWYGHTSLASYKHAAIIVSDIVAALKAARAEEREELKPYLIDSNDKEKIAELEAKLKSVEIPDELVDELAHAYSQKVLECEHPYADYKAGFKVARNLRAIKCWPSEKELMDLCDKHSIFGDAFRMFDEIKQYLCGQGDVK